MLEPADEGVGPGDQSRPGPVGVEVVEGEPAGAAVFDAGDVVLDPGVGAHIGVGPGG